MAGDDNAPRGERPEPPPPPVRPGEPGQRGSGPGQRRAAPSPAQGQFMQHIAANRPVRRRRAYLLACCVMSSLVLLVAGAAWGAASYANDALGRIFAGTAGGTSGPLNLLLAGVDLRTGLTPQQQRALHVGHDVSSNSDTLMLIHIAADRSSVTVVSLPRDSWVGIPGHGMNKINAAFGIGGPPLAVATVEQATGLTINDFIEVNFLGFVKVIDALGGVNICLPQAVEDPYSGLRLGAGVHHVNGVTALKYARDRHSFAASDLARIDNQQRLLSSLLKEAISSGTLTDPLRLGQFARAVLGVIKVDQNLNLIGLADQLRGITPAEVHFLTVPLANTSYLTPTGESAVLWNQAAAGQLFATLKADQITEPAPGAVARYRKARLHRSQVAVDVYNGTLIGGLSGSTGTALARLGFQVHSGLNWPAHDVTRTLIQYPPGHRGGARLLRAALPGATLSQTSGLTRIRIVLGTSSHTVRSAGAPPAAGPAGSRSAALDACR